MKRAKRTIVIIGLALASCSGPVYVPTNTPTMLSVRVLATTTTYPLLQDLAAGYKRPDVLLAVQSAALNWEVVYNQLVTGQYPFALTAFLPADARLWAAPLGYDGIAIIVNAANTVPALTVDQLRALFQGHITRWIEVGGPDLPVTVVSREPGADIYLAFDALVMAAAAVLTFVLLGLRGGTSEESVAQVTDPSLLVFFGAGAVAICAMILPGISGSFLLVTLGMYSAVLSTVNERDLLPLVVFLLGCVTGLALFSQVLHWALEHHYDTVMAALIGLMLGSLRVLWPWPMGVESTALGAPEGPVLLPVVLMVVGAVVVLGVELVSERIEGRTVEDEIEDLRA